MRTNHFAISAALMPFDSLEPIVTLLNVPEPAAYIPTVPDQHAWIIPFLIDQEAVARFEYRRLISESGQTDVLPYGLHAQRIYR